MTKTKKFSLNEIKAGLREVQRELMSGSISAEEFNMNTAFTESCNVSGGCNTVACIGGHLALYLGLKSSDVRLFVAYADTSLPDEDDEIPYYSKQTAKKLEPLFYPYDIRKNWEDATPAEAAVAIERFLNGAKKPWKNI